MEFRDPVLMSPFFAGFLSEESIIFIPPSSRTYGSHSSFIIHYNSRRSDVALHSSHSSLG